MGESDFICEGKGGKGIKWAISSIPKFAKDVILLYSSTMKLNK